MPTELLYDERLDQFVTRVLGVRDMALLQQHVRQLIWDNRIAGEKLHFNTPYNVSNVEALDVRPVRPFTPAALPASVQSVADRRRLTSAQIGADSSILSPSRFVPTGN